MKPMLARTLGPKYKSYPCYVQPKLNGVRALYQKGVFQSRDEKFWREEVLRHLTNELHGIDLGDLILDGELYVHGWRLQDINSAIAVNRLEVTPKTPQVCFYVFDVVDPKRTFSDRWFEVYNGLVAAGLPHVKAVPTNYAYDRNALDQSFNLYTATGYEGIMLRPDGFYEFGEHIGRNGTATQFRSRNLWKYKHWEDGEFLCVGVTQGEGKADIGIGALSCGVGGLTFKVGTGFTDEERVEFMAHPPTGRLIKIRYLNLTTDGIPFNPSFLCVM